MINKKYKVNFWRDWMAHTSHSLNARSVGNCWLLLLHKFMTIPARHLPLIVFGVIRVKWGLFSVSPRRLSFLLIRSENWVSRRQTESSFIYLHRTCSSNTEHVITVHSSAKKVRRKCKFTIFFWLLWMTRIPKILPLGSKRWWVIFFVVTVSCSAGRSEIIHAYYECINAIERDRNNNNNCGDRAVV